MADDGDATDLAAGDLAIAGDDDVDDRPNDGVDGPTNTQASPQSVSATPALIAGSLVLLAIMGLVGWLGWCKRASHQAQDQRNVFLQAGRQGALNLTTISYTDVDRDVQRILDSATGDFYDEFQEHSQPFIDVVKQAQSTSVGSITAAGLESQHGDTAEVLAAVTVKTSNAGAAEQEPRSWRMRVSVKKVGDTAKVSNVSFVP